MSTPTPSPQGERERLRLDDEGRLPIWSKEDPHYGHAMTPSGWRELLEQAAEDLWWGRKMKVRALARWMEEELPALLAPPPTGDEP